MKAPEKFINHAVGQSTLNPDYVDYLECLNNSIAAANKLLTKGMAQEVHGEIHKLANIMGREFGDKVGSFVKQYATQINNDFNNASK